MRMPLHLRLGLAVAAAVIVPLALGASPAVATITRQASGIAAGGGETCALTTEGQVACWGYGRFGELGTGTRTTSLVPVGVVGLPSRIVSVTTRQERSCVITTAGGVA